MPSLHPDFGTDGQLFPPLPEILSPAIRDQVFTHRSFFARPTHIFEDEIDDLSPDNEKYEHLGDSILGLIVTHMMLDKYPGLRVGPSTKVRAMVVGNSTLAEISLKYKLPDYLRLHPAQALTLRASANIQADVFEAFVGGLFLDQGLNAVKQWLVPLFTPYAHAAYLLIRQQHGLPPRLPTPDDSPRLSPVPLKAPSGYPNLPRRPPTTIGHLALFNQELQKGNREVEWVYLKSEEVSADPDIGIEELLTGLALGTKSTPMWYVKVLVDGHFYGGGKGNTKKVAQNEAAKKGLKKLGVSVW